MVTEIQDVRILLVDDDPALLDALPESLRLRAPRVHCDTADGAQSALDRLQQQDYDAVISDIKMPGMDGIQLLERLRKDQPEVPVLLITGHGETDLAIRALRAGAYDLLQKPLDRDYLVSALTRAAEAHRLRREVREKNAALLRHSQELERRVAERTDELVRANQAKDEFLGLVSHELRTPITVILGNADILKRKEDRLPQEVRQQAMSDLSSEARRLQRIVENLLVLARLDHNRRLDREPVLVRELVGAEVRSHQRAFPAREIVVDMSDELPVAFVQPTHLELVLRNLLSNAEKYSPKSAPIRLVVKIDTAVLSVSVLDSGPGISPAETEAIFAPFYRSHETAHLASGLGIGLTVCKRLVEASGGQIWANVRPEGGSEFGFAIPVGEHTHQGMAEETPVLASVGPDSRLLVDGLQPAR